MVEAMSSNVFGLQRGTGKVRGREAQEPLQTAGAKATMPDMTREEIDAKLELVEAKTQTRFVELSAKLDRVLESNNANSAMVTKELSRVHTEIKEARAEVRRDNNFTRWTIAGIVVASLAALWLTQSNLLSAFQAVLAAVKK